MHDSVGFDRNIGRQAGPAERAAGVLATLAENMEQKFGCSVADLRIGRKAGRRIHIDGQLGEFHDAVEIAVQFLVQPIDDVGRAELGGVPRSSQIDLSADLADRGDLLPDLGDLTGDMSATRTVGENGKVGRSSEGQATPNSSNLLL
ncbi:hypothetical protein NKI95_06830 [Mesorhizobium sp. M0306]